MVFDESADDIIIADATGLIFGGDESTADGVKFEFDGTATMNIDALTANDSITFGETTGTDVEFHGANYDIHWDASTDTWRFLDTTILGFGTGGSSDYDIGLAFAAAGTLSWTQLVAGTGSILKGVDGKGIDETWYAETASDYMKWDQDGSSNLGALTFVDSVVVFDQGSTLTDSEHPERTLLEKAPKEEKQNDRKKTRTKTRKKTGEIGRFSMASIPRVSSTRRPPARRLARVCSSPLRLDLDVASPGAFRHLLVLDLQLVPDLPQSDHLGH